MTKAGQIHGVRIEHRVSHGDDRQTLVEVFKTDKVRQINSCLMHKGTEKLRHFHVYQTDWWWVAQGALLLHLYDLRLDSPTFGASQEVLLTSEDNAVVQIPPLVAHGCTVLDGECHLLYATDRYYDPSDEYRIP
jgi:dTDP-4-dehydrorhamnose 3,5-epimerase